MKNKPIKIGLCEEWNVTFKHHQSLSQLETLGISQPGECDSCRRNGNCMKAWDGLVPVCYGPEKRVPDPEKKYFNTGCKGLVQLPLQKQIDRYKAAKRPQDPGLTPEEWATKMCKTGALFDAREDVELAIKTCTECPFADKDTK